jgi:hypothetical protein
MGKGNSGHRLIELDGVDPSIPSPALPTPYENWFAPCKHSPFNKCFGIEEFGRLMM